MKPYYCCVLLLLVNQFLVTEGFFISLGLMGLGIVGLAGLKVYYGSKLIGSAFKAGRSHLEHSMPFAHPPFLSNPAVKAVGPAEPQTPGMLDAGNNMLYLPIVMKSRGSPAAPIRARRALAGGFQLSPGLLKYLETIDDEECLRRFLCDLGANKQDFGNLGRMTNMLIMMGGLPKGSWASEMHLRGQVGKTCPSKCKEDELVRTVKYIERHIFLLPTPAKKSNETKEDADTDESNSIMGSGTIVQKE